MQILADISKELQNGRATVVKDLVQRAIAEGLGAQTILNDGLLHGMGIIGEKFKNDEVFVPEVLVSARAMNMGAVVLKSILQEEGVTASGKAVIGTVKGDLHDIGKNLVKMMMESRGIEVIDLGTDVPKEKFVETANREHCQLVCCSALLTTTMVEMQEIVDAFVAAGIRDQVKIMVGGAPVTEMFCQQIGADCYASNATVAAEAALALCKT